MLDANAGDLERAGNLLLAAPQGGGLVVYGPDGSVRFRLFAGRQLWTEAGFGRALAIPIQAPVVNLYWVVDLATGRVVKAVKGASPPTLLAAAASP